jgi:hypothetical protein
VQVEDALLRRFQRHSPAARAAAAAELMMFRDVADALRPARVRAQVEAWLAEYRRSVAV